MLLLQTERDALLKPLAAICGVVERRHTLPILSHALIEADGGGLSLLASDLEIQLRSHSAIACAQPFRLCAPARKLQDILRALPAGSPVQLRRKGEQLLLQAGGSRFQLQTLPADDFPLLAEGRRQTTELELAQGPLKRKLEQILYAMAGNDIRPYLNGLLLQLDGSELLLVAADGIRLALQRCPLGKNAPAAQAILPRKAALELAKLLRDDDDARLTVTLQDGQVGFELGSQRMISKLLDARAPDYLRLLPDSHDCVLSLPRQPLLEAVQRVAVLAHAKFRQLELAIRPGQLTVRCRNAEREEAEEHLPIDWQGAELDASFNLQYLLDVLASQQAEHLTFGFGNGLRGLLITNPLEPHFQYLAMPLRG
ncbi:DNA polymerase III subunit beta [Chromobacterium sphagni]|uniref:Beta sliding clamp n=1 Tax=Chromobacterium sphagni TaxID=1903179 RepID=A0A1S1X328_9NEIS|nr:DNA polymerase III subunit beta [Chromobacterium sphagni]OHX13636.1 DNA polymerase III subunit beta [Chromobacterium sphagni]OHX18013.1 DNA polymerase III subunit beta [Chromobacterium sphagni]